MTGNQPDPAAPDPFATDPFATGPAGSGPASSLCSWRDSAEPAEMCAQLLTGHPLGQILDAGGGEGFVTAYLMGSRAVETATVVDQSDHLLAQVPPPIRTKRGRLEDLGPEDGEFSTILVRQVLHYVESPETVLGRLRDRLQPAGAIYVGQLVAPDPASARWLGGAASWVSDTRRRVWTMDQLLATFARAGLRLERAAVVPQWQVLNRSAPPQPEHDEVRRLLRLTERDGTVCCRIFWLHALLRAEGSA